MPGFLISCAVINIPNVSTQTGRYVKHNILAQAGCSWVVLLNQGYQNEHLASSGLHRQYS